MARRFRNAFSLDETPPASPLILDTAGTVTPLTELQGVLDALVPSSDGSVLVVWSFDPLQNNRVLDLRRVAAAGSGRFLIFGNHLQTNLGMEKAVSPSSQWIPRHIISASHESDGVEWVGESGTLGLRTGNVEAWDALATGRRRAGSIRQ